MTYFCRCLICEKPWSNRKRSLDSRWKDTKVQNCHEDDPCNVHSWTTVQRSQGHSISQGHRIAIHKPVRMELVILSLLRCKICVCVFLLPSIFPTTALSSLTHHTHFPSSLLPLFPSHSVLSSPSSYFLLSNLSYSSPFPLAALSVLLSSRLWISSLFHSSSCWFTAKWPLFS